MEIMNEPIDYNWSNEDIIREFENYNDKKSIAKQYGISVSTVTKILKEGDLDVQKRR